MKQLYFLMAAFVIQTSIAQTITFPDSTLKSKLLSALPTNTVAKDLNGNYFDIDTNNDNQIQVSEAQQVSWLNLKRTGTLLIYITNLTGLSNFTNLTYLQVEDQKVSMVDATPFANLEELSFKFNNVPSAINVAGMTNLKKLRCDQSMINSLDVSTCTDLELLTLKTNNLATLNLNGLANLAEVDCGSNNLTQVNLSGCTSLKKYDCSENDFQTLDFTTLPTLEILNFSHCLFLQSVNVENLSNLLELACANSNMPSLSVAGCDALKKLQLQGSVHVTTIDLSNKVNLEVLNMAQISTTAVNLTGVYSLKNVDLSHTHMEMIDMSSQYHLEAFRCASSIFLKKLYLKNGSVETLDVYNSILLELICADEEQMQELQEMVDFLSMDCALTSYCTLDPAGTSYEIAGSGKIDVDNNGCDNLDMKIPNFKISVTDGTQTGASFADSAGYYRIPVSAGTHTMTPVFETPNYFTVSPASATIEFPAETSPFSQNFCVTANGNHPDLEIFILPIVRPMAGFDTKFRIFYRNKGNVSQSGSVSLAFQDPILDLVSADPSFSSQVENLLVWNFTDLKPFESREIALTMNLNMPTEFPPVNAGDLIAFTANVQVPNDELPSDNTFESSQIALNSWDPNYKECLQGDVIAPDQVGKYVHYVVHFENTGTAAAQNIVVKDMIDLEKFDIDTLIPLDGSHNFYTRINGNKVEFIFENINLPFDDASNDGYVVFKIKTKPTLVLGDTFSNTASIYFDYNHPIVTEPAVTTIGVLAIKDFEFTDYFTVYPNPAKDVLNLSSKSKIEITSINIYDTLGQLVLTIPNASKIKTIDVSALKTGNYFLSVLSDKGKSSMKFVKK